MNKNAVLSKYLGFATSFGLTMAITVYALYKAGAWLDNKLGTAPIFMATGIILAIGAVFKRLLAELSTLDKMEKDDD